MNKFLNFVLKGFRKRAAHAHPIILEVPPGIFGRVFRTLCLGHKREVTVPGVLAETVESGTMNRCVIEATHVLRRKLRKY